MRGVILAAAMALGLSACAGPDIPFASLNAKYANPQSKWMDLPDGLKVHYRDEGRRDGRAIVLIHGFSASLHAWEPWVQRLAPDYRVITLDLPGHGLTKAPKGYRVGPDTQVKVVDHVTARLGAERFVVGGNSMGGGVSWRYALAYPEKVEALVLVNAAGWPSERSGDGPPLVFRLLGNPVGRAIIKSFDTRPMAEGGLKSAYYDPKIVTPDLIDRYVDFSRAPGHKDILLTQQQGGRTPVTPATFAAIKAPTLIIHGEQDSVIPAASSRGLAGAIPGAKLIIYDGVGHVPMEQIPERSWQDLKAFLKTLP
jgi:pimeloyl-ACP methyl ester carboxylesterase